MLVTMLKRALATVIAVQVILSNLLEPPAEPLQAL